MSNNFKMEMRILCWIGIVVLTSAIKTRDEIKPEDLTTQVDYFNCTQRPDGNYEHPTRCNGQYITCSDNKAYERNCPVCPPTSCPDGHLYYDTKVDACVTSDKAGCPSKPTPTPSTTTTTTPKPTPENPGDPCPLECQQTGYCDWYLRCLPPTNPNEGIWVNSTCPEDLLWQPTPNVGSGGQCVRFADLDAETQLKYKNDPDCFCPCFWEEHESKEGRCEGKYYYWNRSDPDQHDLDRQDLQCPSKLVFNPDIETCDHCQNVRGGECC